MWSLKRAAFWRTARKIALRACATSITGWAFSGREAFARTHATDLADVYADLLQAGELAAMEVHERFYEIGSPAGLQEMTTFLSRRGDTRK